MKKRIARSGNRAFFDFETLPGLLEHTARLYGGRNALNYPRTGSWITYTYEEFRERVKRLALGLIDAGVKPGETVGVIAPSSPEWLIIDLAIQVAQGVTVPIFNKISPESFSHEVKDSGLKLLFVGDPDEMPMAHERCGDGVQLISYGYSGTHEPFEELFVRGSRSASAHPRLYEELLDKIEPDQLATIIYTSGSTGPPKGVELTQRALATQVKDAEERFPRDLENDVCLSILPLAHVFERMVTYFHIASGFPVYFADDPKHVVDYLREIRPTIITVVPRVLEKVYSGFQSAVHEQPWPKRMVASAGMRRAERRSAAAPIDGFYRKRVYSQLTEALGGRLRYVICGSSKLDAKLATFFVNIGVPVYEGYGLTEAAPVISANGPDRRRLGTVGLPFEHVEVRIADDGEILARGPNVMRGYHKDSEATSASVDSEGWLHTGDLGWIDEEGYLGISGRKKELFKKSTGEYVPPAPIETELEKLPFVETAIIFADGRVYVTALLFPDMDALPAFKRRFGLEDMNDREFLHSQFLHDHTEGLIAEINRHRHHCEWIERFTIIDQPASPESGELTPTLKVRRHFIEDKYAKLIQEMYESIGGTK